MAVTPLDASIYNNVWKPDPMQGVDLQKKYTDIKNTQIQNQLLQMQGQSSELDLRAKQNLSEAVKQFTDPKTGEVDWVGLRKFTGAAGNINQFDIVGKGNELTKPTQAGINPAGQPIYKGAQTVATQFNTPNALMPQAATQTPTQPQMQQNSDNALRPNIEQPINPEHSQDQIDGAHNQIDYFKGLFDEMAALPDSELNLKSLHAMGADIGAKNAETSGKLGMPYNDVAGQMAKPEFPKKGPNGQDPSPAALRQFLQNHSQQLAQDKAMLEQNYPRQITAQQAPIEDQRLDKTLEFVNNLPQPQQETPAAPVELTGQAQPEGDMLPGGVMSMPAGFQEKQQASRERINAVQNDATVANKTIPVLDEINNISKGGALTGQASGKIYSYLASHGFAAPGITDETQKLQEIGKYMAQAAIAGGLPASDARLEALNTANTHTEQLPETIQALVPFLRAQFQGNVEKQKFYNSHLKGSLDPDKEVAIKAQWDNNYDPRWLIFDELPPRSKARGEFLHKHSDLLDKLDQYENLNAMGVAKSHKKK